MELAKKCPECFCEPPYGFPCDTPSRCVNAIVRAKTFRKGKARDRIIKCACDRLVNVFGIKTKACKGISW